MVAARDPGAELAGLPELDVEGLGTMTRGRCWKEALSGPLDARDRDLMVAETRGNPLALLELPRGLSPAELAGRFGRGVLGPTVVPSVASPAQTRCRAPGLRAAGCR